MDNLGSESLEKIRQQFDHAPYPRVPLENSPKQEYNLLYTQNLITSHYLRHQQVVETEGKLILDAGSGSGYKSLILAEANPGAKIIGVDISEESVKLARQRLKHHGFENNTEFHVLLIEDLPKLGLEFDYINCDEVLYLLPDPVAGLQALKSVLKPKGIIRANLHSILQRSNYYRSQALFKMMGLMNDNPKDIEIDLVFETMRSLNDNVRLKAQTWHSVYEQPEYRQGILADHLLLEDKGYTIPELFAILTAADLEFFSMLNWRHWEVIDLFKDPDNLPAFWGMSLINASVEERLHLYELLHPVHRLLDFWCALPGQVEDWVPVEQWEDQDWQKAKVHLHPQLRNDSVRENLIHCIASGKPFEISRDISLPTLQPVVVDSTMAACLLPLWEEPQAVTALVDRHLKIKPLHPVTLEPISTTTAFEDVKSFLNRLDAFLYVLLEQST